MGSTIEMAGYSWESNKLEELLFGVIKFALTNTTGSCMGIVLVAPVVFSIALQTTHSI